MADVGSRVVGKVEVVFCGKELGRVQVFIRRVCVPSTR